MANESPCGWPPVSKSGLFAGPTGRVVLFGPRSPEVRGGGGLDGAGHRVRQKAPEAVNAALLDFLASLP